MSKSSSLIAAALAGLWLYGFLGFAANVEGMPDPGISSALDKTDAIVVLTGGSERMATGLALLEAGDGKKLFISGVHKKLSLENIPGARPINASLRKCCIALGYEAASTAGNAEETRDWMQSEGYHSLRLVTANYHMPRSLLLFRAAMPDINIVPHPIAPDAVKLHDWWEHPHTVELLAVEYTKFLLAHIKLRMNNA